MADLEEEMSKVQEDGVVLGRKKLWMITYADDVVPGATNPEGLNHMMKRFRKVIRRMGHELNTEKLKTTTFRNGGRRKKRDETRGNKY